MSVSGHRALFGGFVASAAIVTWVEVRPTEKHGCGRMPIPRRYVGLGITYGLLALAAPFISDPLAGTIGVGLPMAMLVATASGADTNAFGKMVWKCAPAPTGTGPADQTSLAGGAGGIVGAAADASANALTPAINAVINQSGALGAALGGIGTASMSVWSKALDWISRDWRTIKNSNGQLAFPNAVAYRAFLTSNKNAIIQIKGENWWRTQLNIAAEVERGR